jgi:hypothetical protein
VFLNVVYGVCLRRILVTCMSMYIYTHAPMKRGREERREVERESPRERASERERE